jgi:hypothetical protein
MSRIVKVVLATLILGTLLWVALQGMTIVGATDRPTGCPYGDSIPTDSPKCAASTDTNVGVEEPVPERPMPDSSPNTHDYQDNLTNIPPLEEAAVSPMSGK